MVEFFSATVVTGPVTVDRTQAPWEGSEYCAGIPNLEAFILIKK